MNNRTISSSELKVRITKHIQELVEATDAVCNRDEMLGYQDTCAKFQRISPDERLMSFPTLIIAFPRQEMIQIWPLPVQQP